MVIVKKWNREHRRKTNKKYGGYREGALHNNFQSRRNKWSLWDKLRVVHLLKFK